jgi:hypothetical protein
MIIILGNEGPGGGEVCCSVVGAIDNDSSHQPCLGLICVRASVAVEKLIVSIRPRTTMFVLLAIGSGSLGHLDFASSCTMGLSTFCIAFVASKCYRKLSDWLIGLLDCR